MPANIKEIMKFFDYATSAQFAADWRLLSDEEKEFFKVEVGKVIYPEVE